MDEESCATLLLLNTTSIRIVRFIVFGESSAATYKSIHQFTRKETLCRKKILKKLLKFGLLFFLLLELLFLIIFPNNNFLLCFVAVIIYYYYYYYYFFLLLCFVVEY